MSVRFPPTSPPSLGRYTVYGPIAAGGMATIQYGRLVGPGGFSRAVAVKRLHAQFAQDANFVALFLDEARLSARIAHANVVPTLDVLALPGQISVVMEYVHGESLAGLLSLAKRRGITIPVNVGVSLLCGVLHGLQAAHETCNELGEPLHIVHRDVSPENILVGCDGVARLLDFGIAKAKERRRTTPDGELKGKLGYMSPEQYRGEPCDVRADVYGAAVVLWETLTGCVLFDGPSDAAVVNAVLRGEVTAPSALVPDLPTELDRIVLKGLSGNREARFGSAREMALALEQEIGVAPQSTVSGWVEEVAGSLLEQRAEALRQMELRFRKRGGGEEGAAGTRRVARAPGTELERELVRTDDRVASGAAPSGWHAKPRAQRLSVAGALLALATLGAWFAAYRLQASSNAPPQAESTDTAARLAAPTAQPQESDAPHEREPDHPHAELPLGAPTRVEPAQLEERDEQTEAKAPEPPTKRVSRNRPMKPEKPRPHAPAACNPPYTVDEMGIRRWKRECL